MTSYQEDKYHACIVFLLKNHHSGWKMPSCCVVFGCSNIPDPANGIVLHRIPFDGDLRPEAVKRRKRWVDFVKRRRAKWEPSSTSCVCSKHFKQDDFDKIANVPGQQTNYRPLLKRDDIGVTSFPSIFQADERVEVELSGRAARAIKRKVRNEQLNKLIVTLFNIFMIYSASNSFGSYVCRLSLLKLKRFYQTKHNPVAHRTILNLGQK